MTDRLLIQSIGDDHQDVFVRNMALEEPIHREYAERCGADYEYFIGFKDPACSPTWNRIVMMLDAFDRGYRKVVWLDADTLVVNLDEDVFEKTSNDAPLLMTRVVSSHVSMPWEFDPITRTSTNTCSARRPGDSAGICALGREEYKGATEAEQLAGTKTWHVGPHRNGIAEWPQWDVYNDGVLIVNDDEHAVAREALTFAWENRHAPFKPWHVPGMPELDWLLDYVFHFPAAVEQLHGRWNWMGYEEDGPRDEAVVMAWHGHPIEPRWQMFRSAYREFYG